MSNVLIQESLGHKSELGFPIETEYPINDIERNLALAHAFHLIIDLLNILQY